MIRVWDRAMVPASIYTDTFWFASGFYRNGGARSGARVRRQSSYSGLEVVRNALFEKPLACRASAVVPHPIEVTNILPSGSNNTCRHAIT